jgi:hypothetical protein
MAVFAMSAAKFIGCLHMSDAKGMPFPVGAMLKIMTQG